MRTILVIIILNAASSVNAQTLFRGSNFNHLQQHTYADNNHFKDSTPAKKWFVSKYFGLSSSFSVFNGGTATVLSAPIGLQLNRRLNNNWYAFAGVAIATAYVNFNQSFLNTNSSKFSQTNNFLQSKRFDIYSRAELGLMYVNDQKTFSISASISTEKSSFPIVPINQISSVRPTAFFR